MKIMEAEVWGLNSSFGHKWTPGLSLPISGLHDLCSVKVAVNNTCIFAKNCIPSQELFLRS